MATARSGPMAQACSVTAVPRVEIAPGIFAESVVKGIGADRAQVYLVTGGAFEHLELESMTSLLSLVSILSSLEPDDGAGADTAVEPAHRHWEIELPVPAAGTTHRRFLCHPDAPVQARAWIAATLGALLPPTDWAAAVVELAGSEAVSLLADAAAGGAAAVLLTIEISDRRLALIRLDELPGGLG
jgi:hypothetical protein